MTAAATRSPVDHGERTRIERDGLGETLFVEAGAGTGKTHELVERVFHLVVDTGVPLSTIAAITFTEAAATELAERVQERFERHLAEDPTGPGSERCRTALAEVDEAAITTLHGFALRILGEHPVEVGLPPRVELLDEVSSQLAFHDRWRSFLDELYDDPHAESLLVSARALGINIERRWGTSSLEDVAAVFEDGWDRLDAVAALAHPPLPPVDLAPVAPATMRLRALATTCAAPDDKLLDRVLAIVGRLEGLLAEEEPARRLAQLQELAGGSLCKVGNIGKKGDWDDVKATRDEVVSVGEVLRAVVDTAVDDVLRRFATLVATSTRSAAERRRAEGRLVFHDLLVLARQLVRTSPSARTALHHRYQRLLLDELQDTDPIQIELAVLLAAAVDDPDDRGEPAPGSDEGHRPWSEIEPEAGRLFFVGDPKQSIYRFRRADIGLYLDARDAFGGATTVRLRQNFRTVEPILDWVNHVFGQLMAEEQPRAQPRYQPLDAFRTGQPGDHRPLLLGGARDLRAGPLREAEARAVAGAIADIRDHPGDWPVHDPASGQWRDPRLADVTVLVPTRTSLRALEDALDHHAVPYRIATGTLVWDTQEVRQVLAALRAVDDPGDQLSLVAALRSPVYACSDVDLFTFRQAGGRLDLRRPPPAELADDHPVVLALAHLRSLWDVRWWHEPSALIERLLHERRVAALGFATRRPREVWRRLRFVVDQARAFQEADARATAGSGLRGFLGWAELQRREGTRAHEPMAAETDDDAVSILTIHGAKGLEFPITFVSGTTTAMTAGRRSMKVLWEGDVPEIKLKAGAATEHFNRLADLEAEMDVHERARLLYVACTRARDHLVVSAFHQAKAESYGRWLHELSGADGGDGAEDGRRWRRLPDRPAVTANRTAAVAGPPELAPVDGRQDWLDARERLVADRGRERFVSATAVAREAQLLADREDGAEVECVEPADGGELDIDDRAADLVTADQAASDGDQRPATPWRRGRAGTAIGRAVHATLELYDDPGDIDALAAQQAHVEAVPELADTVAAMARSALRAPSVQASASAPRSWRELYVAAPVGDRAVEGYIDLLYETSDGLVLVDYKTDTVAGPADADAKVDRYGRQAATYALALEASTGLSVAAAHLVFCTTGEPIERPVPDLAETVAEVRAQLEASQHHS